MNKKVKIQIFPDGLVQAEVQGIKGKKCTNYIKILENLLDAETIDSDYTKEYYESEKLTIKNSETEYENLKISE